MTYTLPTDDDLAALRAASAAITAAELALHDTNGQLQLVTSRLSEPAPPPPPPDPALPAVGIGGSGAFGGLPAATRQEYLALMRAAGITHFRTDCRWDTMERTRGVYVFDGVKTRIREIIAAGMVPQLLVGWAPKFYRKATSTSANDAPLDNDTTRHAWDAFLRAMFAALVPLGALRYEIWNEPNFQFMQPVSPALWADLVIGAHVAASDISRRIVIVAGGVCPAVDTPPTSMSASKFYDAVLTFEPDFFNFVDEVGTHPYAGDHNKLTAGKFFLTQQSHIASLAPADVPLCATEFGWKSGKNTEAERVTLYTDAIVSYPDKRAPLFLFSAYDFTEAYGILDSAGRPKPVYDAIRKLLTA